MFTESRTTESRTAAARTAVGRTKPARRRLSAALLATATIAGFAPVMLGVTAAHAVGSYSNADLADKALTYVGGSGTTACAEAHQSGGDQCKQFANCIVYMVSGHSQWPVDSGGNYQRSYLDAGGVAVTAATAVKGDIIQEGTYDGDQLHTAIVVANNHDGSFDVVDANYVAAGIVGHHRWVPPISNIGYYRMGAVAPAIPAGFNVALWGFNSGQTLSGTVNLTAHPTQSGVIEWLDYVIDGPGGYHSEVRAGGGALNYPYALDTTRLANGTYTISMTANETDGLNHTYGGGSFTTGNTPPAVQYNTVLAKNSIGLYNWTKESDPVVVAGATGGGVQMILDNNGVVWAKDSIGLYNWVQESDPGVKAIAVGSDGTQMILDSTGSVLAKNGIGLYNWTVESDPGIKAIATNGGVQMILDNSGTVLAKNSIGLYNWTQESDAVVQSIAVGSDGTQMILDNSGTVLAKNSIGLYNWTQESDAVVKAISTNGGVQMILDNSGTVLAKNSIGLYNWTQESDAVVQSIAMGADGTQMILDNSGTVLAKNSIGLYNWTQESDAVVKSIAAGSDGTQMILSR
ncbi:hypothetical protein P3T37_006997 [Kitasatospora sp. MAA4]|uniref:hypothetical protein n=1 Tax=Kitasatospora sp. MAA4 TaxID=3035093 RepID=UPI00247649BD|nr:hypothetical protein [Kitasatospora sp. MAA4]MDH6137564.1 hypothetical protein [Kitasatospora sp. MAA4]